MFKNIFKDSIAIATTKTIPYVGDNRETRMRSIFEPIIAPQMKQRFFDQWHKWFVLTDEVKDLRQPGLLKSKI